MLEFVLVIIVTLAVSFVCSLFEAFILSTTSAEVEALKQAHPARGQRLETIKHELESTLSAILTLSTIVNVLGAVVIGAVGAPLFGVPRLVLLSLGFGTLLLVGSRLLPRSMGVIHRRTLQPYLVSPLWWLRRLLRPVSWACNGMVRAVIRPGERGHTSDEEIILLAERGARQGTISKNESKLIANALSLDEIRVSEIMTPRTVVTALRKSATIATVFREYANLPFGRLPVYGRNLDDIVGLVRRRDLLKAKANDQDAASVESLMHEVHFVPATATAANALQVCLQTHQKLLVVVDEFGATAGVIAIEDIVEHLIGSEISEKDDVAVDMRELARTKQQRRARPKRNPEAAPATPPAPAPVEPSATVPPPKAHN